MRILYVENHARFARITVSQFLSAHSVTIVPGIGQARQVLAKTAFDAVLVDCDLDDGKGDELVLALQAQVHRPFIIGVSAHQPGNDALLAAGADAICPKMQFSGIETVLLNRWKIKSRP